MSQRGKRQDRADAPAPRREETLEVVLTETDPVIKETPEAKEAPGMCAHCKATARPTRDGKHKCQCRTEKV